MKLYIADKEKLTIFKLPKEVKESFLVSYKSDITSKDYKISIESKDNSWKLQSNGLVNVIENGNTMTETILEDYKSYALQVADDKENKLLFCLPNIEKSISDVNISGLLKITIGGSPSDNIFFSNPNIYQSNIIITKDEKNNWFLSTSYTNVYVNNKLEKSKYLRVGDVIFLYGLKIIFMGTYMKIYNTSNQIVINGLQSYSNYMTYSKGSYKKSDSVDESDLYKNEDYFYHIPRISQAIEEKIVTIDSPPDSFVKEEIPLILSMSSSIIMGFSSLLSLYSIIGEYKSGNTDKGTFIISIITCLLMLMTSLAIPLITSRYVARKNKNKEKERQLKYSEYLDSKEKEIKSIIQNNVDILNKTFPSEEDCYNRLISKDKKIWEKNLFENDFLGIRVGLGKQDSLVKIESPKKTFSLEYDNLKERIFKINEESKYMEDSPIITNLKDNIITSIVLESKNSSCYLNGLILQLVTEHSALDLKIVYLSDSEDFNYEYLKYLPHSWSEDKTFRFYSDNLSDMKSVSEFLQKELKERKKNIKENSSTSKDEKEKSDLNSEEYYKTFSTYYLIITGKYKNTKDLGIIKDILKSEGSNYGFSLMVFDNKLKDLPIECKNYIYVNDTTPYLIEKVNGTNDKTEKVIKTDFNIKELKSYDMHYAASFLANIPVSAKMGASELPKSLTFLEMYGVSKIEQLNILSRWKNNNPTISLKTPIGVHADRDLFILDLHEKAHGPHGLIAGSTGSGKSEFIITFVLSMAINYHPYEVSFVLIDYKGGGLAGAFENREKGISIPHLAGTITNLDTSEMNRTLVSINSELKRRQSEFNKARDALGEGTIDIYKYQRFYREGKVKDPIPHLFIISDEFAELKQQQPDFMDELISTARIGRSLGVHLILATQKPSGVVNDQIWANSKFKICLKVQDNSDSMEMLRKPDAASIKETGRFYLQVGYDEYFDIGQSGWAGAKYIPSDKIVKKIDDDIDFIDNLGNKYRTIGDEVETTTKVEDLGEQLPNIVKYMVDLAKNQKIKTKMLWLSSIPDLVFTEGLKVKYNYKSLPYEINPVIGEYDNPAMQKQDILTLDITNTGNTSIYGMTGSGKENLLTTIIYDTCLNHGPDEVNFYIVDLGAETLKMFSKYPQVGAVATADDFEKISNLFNKMAQELVHRKEIFSEYGGNYKVYLKESGQKLPLIVIIINGYDVFSDSYSRLEDFIFPILREGSKYGISVIASTTLTNGIGGRVSQMFTNTITMQQKDEDVYRDLTNCQRGLSIKKFFGRGVVAKGKTGYEFQTAFISQRDKINETIRNTAKDMLQKYNTKAIEIKTFPKIVELSQIQVETTGLDHVAIGVNRVTLNTSFYNFDNLPVTLILSNRIFDNFGFVNALVSEFSYIENLETTVVDATGLFKKILDNVNVYNDNFEEAIKNIIIEVNKENDKKKRVFIFMGIGVIRSMLSELGLKLYDGLFSNISRFKNSKIILVDDYEPFENFKQEQWYNEIVTGNNGIWLGTGATRQDVIDFSRLTDEQEDQEFNNIAYTCGSNGVILFKYVVEDGDKENE